MNQSWRTADADAHHAKAEAIETAIEALCGLHGALDNIEDVTVVATVNMLQRARVRHVEAAKLAAVA